MKKAITTIGLFSLMMVLTSFTTTQEITSSTKIDDKIEIFKIENIKLEISGAGGTGGNKKVDDMPTPEKSILDKISDWWDSL